MPHLREMFPRRYLSMHDFRQGETVVVTVKSVELAHATVRPGGFGRAPQVQEPKWLLYFHEYPKPMELRPGRAAKLVAALGSERSEDWVGKRLQIYRGFTDIAGEAVEGLLIDTRPVPQLPPPQPVPQLVTSDTRPVPRAAVDRFLENAKQLKGSWDGLLAWCRANSAEAFAKLWGLDLDHIPAGALPAMKAYLDSLAPAAPTPSEVVDRATGEVITTPRPASAMNPLTPPPPSELDDLVIPF